MNDLPLITLWEFKPPKGSTLNLTSSPPVRIEQNPFPNRGIWISGTPWYCCGIEASGIERATGSVSAITIRIQLTEYVKARKNLIFTPGTRVARYQTDVLAADGANWSSGTNPYGTPTQTNHRIDRWVLTRNTDEAQDQLTVNAQDEQAFWTDLVRPDVPGRCYHKYRGSDCGYTGTNYFDAQGNTVTTAAEDVCGLSIEDCELRFPTGALPYGGLPILEGLE